MSIAVAHQVTAVSDNVLAEGAREAALRGVPLSVIHVTESLDGDKEAALRAGISDALEKVLGRKGLTGLTWDLHIVTGVDDLGAAILDAVSEIKPEILVIGARRRSPVGKAFLGSVAQTIVLEADVPVLVVKRSAT